MKKGYYIKGDVIVLERDLTELDLFLKGFLNILKKHTDYLVVSGYISLCSGRTRATEDIDIIVPKLSYAKFGSLFDELSNNYWCYQSDNAQVVYSYIKSLTNIRFAKKDTLIPNIELITFDESKKAKLYEFNHPQEFQVGDFKFRGPPIEFEILYKEIILGGKKDIDDANHLRVLFSDILSKERFKLIEPIIRAELK